MTTEKTPFAGFFKGATSYEFWVWRLYGRWCFLRGGKWGNVLDLSRFSFGWENGDERI